MMRPGAALAVALLAGLTLAPARGDAIENCKVKVDKKNGTVLVSAASVVGSPQWGVAVGQETNVFSNEATCVVGGTAKSCTLGSVGNAQRITPPDLCTIYLADGGATDCSTYIKGCTPGIRTVGAGAVVAGTVVPYAGTAAPEGWLLCDGSAVSRTTYAALFAAIGISHGLGDGVNTFNLPDYRGRFLRGADLAAGRDPDAGSRTAMNFGGSTGDNVGSVQGVATSMPVNALTTDVTGSHQHWVNQLRSSGKNHCCDIQPGSIADFLGGIPGASTDFQGNHSHSITGGGDAETRPVNAYVNWIIKY
jgi:microcystin-dependent protein